MTTGEAIRAELTGSSAGAAAVTALVAGRIYPNLMPQGTTWPAVVYQVISEVPQNTLADDSSTRLLECRVQVDCYSQTYLGAHAVADAVDAVLANLARPDLSAWREISRDLYDNDMQLHRVSADYVVFRGNT